MLLVENKIKLGPKIMKNGRIGIVIGARNGQAIDKINVAARKKES